MEKSSAPSKLKSPIEILLHPLKSPYKSIFWTSLSVPFSKILTAVISAFLSDVLESNNLK
jgi:hypothetical protein